MRFPRSVCALVLIVVSVGAAGCGGNDNASSSEGTDAESLTISLVTGDNKDVFFVTVNKGAQAAAEQENVIVEWQGPPAFDASQQIPILNAVLAKQPDAALICATDSKALIAPMRAFMDAEIPVIDGLGCGPVDDETASLGAVDTNNIEGGKAAGEHLVQTLPEGSKVGYVGLAPGNRAGDDRQKGFEQAVQAGGLTYIGPEYVDYDATKAAAATSALLQKHPDIRGFFGVDGTYGSGIGTAVQAAGKSDAVTVVAYDGTPTEVQSLRRGILDALIVQPAYKLGFDAVTIAVNHLRSGEAVPAMTSPGVTVVTRENVESPEAKEVLYVSK